MKYCELFCLIPHRNHENYEFLFSIMKQEPYSNPINKYIIKM